MKNKISRTKELIEIFYKHARENGLLFSLELTKFYLRHKIAKSSRLKYQQKIDKLTEPMDEIRKVFTKIKKIDIVNVNFFDWNGEVLYKGGAERYVFDLANLLSQSGIQVRILQNANIAFNKMYKGIEVVGVKTSSGGDLRALSKVFDNECKGVDIVIASPAELACEIKSHKTIGINHGIFWDYKLNIFKEKGYRSHKNTFDSLEKSELTIAVDTNFINWVRTYSYPLAKKIRYIPNYYSKTEFSPIEKNFDSDLVVLYPRRLSETRGIFITLQAFEKIFELYQNVTLHLVGQADNKTSILVNEYIKKFDGRVIWEELEMDQMITAYQKSHIALIPTMYSEGTSLSCLEALATNNAVIATNVGGLPNLVIDHYNGLLIDPSANELTKAIELLIHDRNLLKYLANNGLSVSSAFEKNNWNIRWLEIINL